jgi:hypothetical protein
VSEHRYKIGDRIVLKDGPNRMQKATGPCKVVAALPESRGIRQYRVRFESETYERMISEDDIDVENSPASGSGPVSSQSTKGKDPWLKASNVRTGK